jgi:hypothetical protein
MKLTHVHRISTTSKLTGHPLYKEAKQGNPEAAQKVMQEIIPVKNQFRYLNGFVCPVLKQNGNQIPMALARIMASHSNLVLDDSIFLQHTSHGSSMTERLYYQPSFSGMVKPADYVIVDDVYTTGKTLKSLKNYIESKGGNVISAWCIGSGPSLEFEPKRMLLRLLTAKFPTINRYFDLNELTSPQIHYLLRLSSLNKLWMIHADNQLSLMLA